MKRLGLSVLALVAASCTSHSPPVTAENACHVDRYQNLIGKELTPEVESKLPAKTRVVCMGCMMTMEYVADRLTIQLGPGKTIASMKCS